MKSRGPGHVSDSVDKLVGLAFLSTGLGIEGVDHVLQTSYILWIRN